MPIQCLDFKRAMRFPETPISSTILNIELTHFLLEALCRELPRAKGLASSDLF